MKAPHIIILPLVLMIYLLAGCGYVDPPSEAPKPRGSSSGGPTLTPQRVHEQPPKEELFSSANELPDDTTSSESTSHTGAVSQDAFITSAETKIPHAEVSNITEAEALDVARQAVRDVVGINSSGLVNISVRDGYYVVEFSTTNGLDFIRRVVVNAKDGEIKYIWMPAQ